MPINILYRESSTETPPSKVDIKGSPLSSKEIDANFKSISNTYDKVSSDLSTARSDIDTNAEEISKIKSQKNHASSGTEYGIGGSLFGHLKISDTGSDAASEGIAASTKYVSDVNSTLTTSIKEKAPILHSSTNGIYGVGDTSKYGHVKISDSGSNTASDSVAASPKYVSDVNASLSAAIDTKAAKSHASSTTTYGVGNASNYGHVKISDSGSNTASDSVAASPKYVNDTKTSLENYFNPLINGKAPTSHASSTTTYGVGNASNYGHVKISDSGSDAASTSIAASPKYVSDVNSSLTTAINGKAPSSHASSTTTYGVGNANNYGHVKISDTDSSTVTAANSVAASPAAVTTAISNLRSELETILDNLIAKY